MPSRGGQRAALRRSDNWLRREAGGRIERGKPKPAEQANAELVVRLERELQKLLLFYAEKRDTLTPEQKQRQKRAIGNLVDSLRRAKRRCESV